MICAWLLRARPIQHLTRLVERSAGIQPARVDRVDADVGAIGLADGRSIGLLEIRRNRQPLGEEHQRLAAGQRALRLHQRHQREQRGLSPLLESAASTMRRHAGNDLPNPRFGRSAPTPTFRRSAPAVSVPGASSTPLAPPDPLCGDEPIARLTCAGRCAFDRTPAARPDRG